MMIKLVYCMNRKPGMTRAEFQNYWKGIHAPIGGRIPGVKKFVQSHAIDVPGDKQTAAYDGMVELWFESVDDLLRARKTIEWELSTRDEETFVDPERVAYFVTVEHEIL